MLTRVAKKHLRHMAKRDFNNGVSNPGFVYNFVDEHFGWAMAEAALQFYGSEQKRLLREEQNEIARLNNLADQAEYQRGVEM